MRRCLELASKGKGSVNPNPLVGCVIVQDSKIISEGFHERFGGAHAEVNAITKVNDKKTLKDSTLYVNLEPCCHHGKTPPCTDLIISSGIQNVVIGSKDPNSKVNGKGIKRLQANKIKVTCDILEKECVELNYLFYFFHSNTRPFITLKWAESRDGYTAPYNQNQKFWMTNEKSKKIAHQIRSERNIILVGNKTVIKDNPFLTDRYYNNNPIRALIDLNLKVDLNHNIFNSDTKTYIFNLVKSEINDSNIFVKISKENTIRDIIKFCYNNNYHSLLVEGGAYTHNEFIKIGLWDEIVIFKTNKILNTGTKAPNFSGRIVEEKKLDDNIKFKIKPD